MRYRLVILLAWMSVGVASALGQSTNLPHIGYLYPAGGVQNSITQITVGGQFLRGANAVHISGEGVRGRIVKYLRPVTNINSDQRKYLNALFKAVQDGRDVDGIEKPEGFREPQHPLLMDVEHSNAEELNHVKSIIFTPRAKRQLNRQLSEMVVIELTISSDAIPGDRELRLDTRGGLTNPVIVQVGTLPEVEELEPNNQKAFEKDKGLKTLETPVTINGQIFPGDQDRFRFKGRKGQKLVINTAARHLIPYLADAVPGWFQATVTLFDNKGRQLAFVDDYRFNPDPVMFYDIPEDGEYELLIHDAIYRGREDFVYRISISEQPFVTSLFPLGVAAGANTLAKVDGWNVPRSTILLDSQRKDLGNPSFCLSQGTLVSNPVTYAISTLPEMNENEMANNDEATAKVVSLPHIINGQISVPGEVDIYRIEGKAKESIVAEVFARRLNSPMDSLVRIFDEAGKLIAVNDDYSVMEKYLHVDTVGTMTHHADSYVMTDLPHDGAYFIHVTDAQNHGSNAHSYRLRVARPLGDFTLRCTPSSLTVNAGSTVDITVHALRKDGYDGEIEIKLKDAPKGFSIQGGIIPAGCDSVHCTIQTAEQKKNQTMTLELIGQGKSGFTPIIRPVVPADDTMQAFLYRHLVPAESLMVALRKTSWNSPRAEVALEKDITLRPGKLTEVAFKIKRNQDILKKMNLELRSAPEGISLQKVTATRDGIVARIKADRSAEFSAPAANLVFNAYRMEVNKQKKKYRVEMGTLPAVPVSLTN